MLEYKGSRGIVSHGIDSMIDDEFKKASPGVLIDASNPISRKVGQETTRRLRRDGFEGVTYEPPPVNTFHFRRVEAELWRQPYDRESRGKVEDTKVSFRVPLEINYRYNWFSSEFNFDTGTLYLDGLKTYFPTETGLPKLPQHEWWEIPSLRAATNHAFSAYLKNGGKNPPAEISLSDRIVKETEGNRVFYRTPEEAKQRRIEVNRDPIKIAIRQNIGPYGFSLEEILKSIKDLNPADPPSPEDVVRKLQSFISAGVLILQKSNGRYYASFTT